MNKVTRIGKAVSIVIDVRPQSEYQTAHRPRARSITLPELKPRLKEIPRGNPGLAYCRGPFCLMAMQALGLRAKKGFKATHQGDGVAEWRSRGLPLVNDLCATSTLNAE